MWDYLVCLSTWAENNSGQIQCLIATVALYFAFQGYRGLLSQLKISNKQEQIANGQRSFELYTKIISEFGQAYYLAKQSITKYKDVMADYELFIKELTKNKGDEVLIERLKEIIKTLKEQEASVKSMENRIANMLKDFKKAKNSDIGSMRNVLEKLIPLSSNLSRVGESPQRMKIHLRKLKERVI